MEFKDVKEVISKELDIRGMPLAVLAERTGIDRNKIFKTFGKNATRKLLAEEFVTICAVLQLSLNDFVKE